MWLVNGTEIGAFDNCFSGAINRREKVPALVKIEFTLHQNSSRMLLHRKVGVIYWYLGIHIHSCLLWKTYMNKLQGMVVTEEDKFQRNILLGTVAVDSSR